MLSTISSASTSAMLGGRAIVRKDIKDIFAPEDDGDDSNDIESRTHLDYWSCTVAELRRLLIARTGQVPKGCKLKHDFVESLERADQDWQFRFLDLPPELRNLLYGELLHFRGPLGYREDGSRNPDRMCWPAILSVSKQLHAEAEGVLYGENEFQIYISQQYHTNNRYHVTRVMVENAYYIDESAEGLSWIADGTDDASGTLPDLLLKAQHLSIEVKLAKEAIARPLSYDETSTNDFQDINYYLYYICSFLAENKSLRKVTVSVDCSKCAEFDTIAYKVLWPLVKLPNPRNLVITGVPALTVDSLLGEMRQLKSGNIFQEALDLLDRASRLKDALRYTGELGSSSKTLSGIGTSIRNVLEIPGYVDRGRNAQLIRLVPAWRRSLDARVHDVEQVAKQQAQRLEALLKELAR